MSDAITEIKSKRGRPQKKGREQFQVRCPHPLMKSTRTLHKVLKKADGKGSARSLNDTFVDVIASGVKALEAAQPATK